MVRDSFSGREIPRGTGIMYVRKDGTIYYFAGKKSEKNFLQLHRVQGKTKWTEAYQKEKQLARGKAKPKKEESKVREKEAAKGTKD